MQAKGCLVPTSATVGSAWQTSESRAETTWKTFFSEELHQIFCRFEFIPDSAGSHRDEDEDKVLGWCFYKHPKVALNAQAAAALAIHAAKENFPQDVAVDAAPFITAKLNAGQLERHMGAQQPVPAGR